MEKVKGPMNTQVTDNISVSVMATALPEHSDAIARVFAFSYEIAIENQGAERVQLLERHWVITSGGQHLAEVVGPGVVGEQPVLGPGEVYRYTSGAVIQDPLGSMHGSYPCRSDSGRSFQVRIPPFDLCYPVVVH